MKLVELINYFRKGGHYEEFCQSQTLNPECEVVEIFMKKPFAVDNDLEFFEIEKTEGKIAYVFNGVEYFHLFDFYYFVDAIEESKSPENAYLTDNVIAKRLYDYAINDA